MIRVHFRAGNKNLGSMLMASVPQAGEYISGHPYFKGPYKAQVRYIDHVIVEGQRSDKGELCTRTVAEVAYARPGV